MPVASVFWPDNAAEDIHLVPGFVGPRLDQLLWASQTVGTTVRADQLPAPAVLIFAANFAAGPGTSNVSVNAATGEVTVTAPGPAPPRLLDFIVTGTVTEGANVFRGHRRFRIHGGITRMWLTPAPLTVRQAARNIRFSLLAEFDDGTYGNLTSWSPFDPPAATDRTYVRLVGIANAAIVWSSSAAGTVAVDAVTGRLTGAAAAGAATITADLRPLGPPPAARATATANAAARWSTPVTLDFIDGPGVAAMGTVGNVLILPDGFTAAAADRAAFERMARGLAQRLRVRRRTRPFDLLKDQINYFSAWVESREGGISPLEVVRRFNVAGTRADAREVDTAVPDAAVAGAWHVAAPPAPAAVTQFLVNERDTAFHVGLGHRPSAQRPSSMRVVSPNLLRFDENDFDDFLRALRTPAGAAVGATWARAGADEGKILILSRSLRNGGSNNSRLTSGHLIGMTLDKAVRHRIEDNAAGRGKDLVPDAVPAAIVLETWTTAAHELAHSFTANDEYGGGGALPAAEVASLAAYGNIAPRANLLTAGNLDADKVKWRWPRIQKAGVLVAPPLAVGAGRFRVRLRPGHAAPFAVGDVVRFRLRPLLTAPAPTDRFIVVTQAGDEVEVEALTAAPFVPATFVAGTALISPVRAPDPNLAGRVFGDDLELMHATVRARITATRNPLNAAAGAAANRPCPGPAPLGPTAATNFPGGVAPSPPIYSSWIVGLYENGVQYDCDVYRPTGVCLMRTLHYDDTSGTERAYQFCPVCRYAMVDFLDPSKHGDIDADYAPRYPT